MADSGHGADPDIPTFWDSEGDDRRLLDELRRKKDQLSQALADASSKGDPGAVQLREKIGEIEAQLAALGSLGQIGN